MLHSGIHATVAGVVLAFAVPVRTRINEQEFLSRGRRALDEFDAALGEPASSGAAALVLTNAASQEALHALERLCEQAQPPLHKFEHGLHGLVAFGIMPLFALANAGVHLRGDVGAALGNPVTLGVMLGLVLGKPVGITLCAWLAERAGVASRPDGVSWGALHAVSWLGGIGFTMSLFVAGLAFGGEGALLEAAKIGVLAASLTAGVLGWGVVRRSCRRVAP